MLCLDGRSDDGCSPHHTELRATSPSGEVALPALTASSTLHSTLRWAITHPPAPAVLHAPLYAAHALDRAHQEQAQGRARTATATLHHESHTAVSPNTFQKIPVRDPH